MQSLLFSFIVLAVGTFISTVTADSYFFNGTGLGSGVADISTGCSDALQASISCDGYLKWVMTSDFYGTIGNDTDQDSFCNPNCGTGLSSYRASVATACANDPEPFDGIPATYWADSASSAWTSLCLKNPSTGEYCTDFMTNLFGDSTTDSDGTGIPSDQLCSPCVISIFRHMQSTPYSNYDDNLASVWSTIQSTCKISYPTDVPSLDTNVKDFSNYAPAGTAYNAACLSGVLYKVVAGDNCETIAESHNVATGTLIAINSLFPDCSNLQLGASICMPLSCTTYLVKSGDSCTGIASGASVTFQQIIAWNPSINSYCSNLLSGTNICVSPPGGAQSLTTIAGATVTQTAVYATTTVARPSPVASGTTRNCGKYYQIQSGDYCQLVALNKTIDLGLFEAINPQINSGCTNLLLGEYYCIFPTADWNSTATSTTVTAPTTTPSGTTDNCYEYYIVQSGDYCGKIEDLYAITFAQLQYWNPDLQDDCSNLDLGEAYCVHGAEQPPGASPVSTSAAPRAKRTGGSLEPRETAAVVGQGGGVPHGWPGLKAPRMQMGLGLEMKI